MSESVIVEIWEYQKLSRQKWIIDDEHSWTYRNFEKCVPPDELTLPSSEWCWATNWRVFSKAGETDGEGWEYAGKFHRFKIPNRKPKIEKSWNSRSRRRMWFRIRRHEASFTSKTSDLTKSLPRIQSGLSSIQQARLRIEDIVKQAPYTIQSEEMKPILETVRKNIADILIALDQCEQQAQQPSDTASSYAGVIKKLRNDVLKEQNALEKVVNPSFIEKTKGMVKRTSFSGRQSFNTNISPRPSESFSRYSDVPPMKLSDLSDRSSPSLSKNPFDNTVESENRESEIVVPISTSLNITPTPSINSNGEYSSHSNKNVNTNMNMNKSNGVISSHDISSSFKGSTVKRGSAMTFDPSTLTSEKSKNNPLVLGLNDNWETPKEGVLIDRNMQERMIDMKLRPVDEATVMQSIIDERADEIKKIHKGIVQLQDMFVDLSRIVKQQQVEIDKIFDNVEESHAKTQDAFNNIVKAEKLQRSGNCIIS